MRVGVALAALLAWGATADAQRATEPPCVLDKCVAGSPTPASGGATSPRATGSFDFYVLALSWSPGFCDTGGAGKAHGQCADGAKLGFVVHGLWPQNTHGFPSDCDGGATRFPSRAALDRVRDLYPSEGLARYEWRKHGTCTGLSPSDYFDQVRRAREAVTIPASLQTPDEPQTLAPLDIVRAFSQANARLRADQMAVTCRQGELEEVRVCFTKDLRGFTPCPEISRASCRARDISVLPVH